MHGTHTKCKKKKCKKKDKLDPDLYTLRVVTVVNSVGCKKCRTNINHLFHLVRCRALSLSLCTNTASHARLPPHTYLLQSKFKAMEEAGKIDKIEVVEGSSWEVLHIQEHWTPTTIALDQDLKLIQAGTCNPAAAVV